MKIDKVKYYDETAKYYQLGWDPEHMHYGFDFGELGLGESLINTIEQVIQYLEIKPGDNILDSGCGMGGTSRYIIDRFCDVDNISVTGILLSKVLLKQTKKLSKRYDKKKLNFFHMDFTQTKFKDESFHKIFFIESACHEENKHKIAKEVYRLLQPGGRLVILDYFKKECTHISEENRKKYNDFLTGWHLPALPLGKEFADALKLQGFSNIAYSDKTPRIIKCSEHMYKMGKKNMYATSIGMIQKKIEETFHRHNLSMIYQFELLNTMWEYGVLIADK